MCCGKFIYNVAQRGGKLEYLTAVTKSRNESMTIGFGQGGKDYLLARVKSTSLSPLPEPRGSDNMTKENPGIIMHKKAKRTGTY